MVPLRENNSTQGESGTCHIFLGLLLFFFWPILPFLTALKEVPEKGVFMSAIRSSGETVLHSSSSFIQNRRFFWHVAGVHASGDNATREEM